MRLPKTISCRSVASWLTKPKTRSWPKFSGFSPALTSRLSRLCTSRSCLLRLSRALSGGQIVFGKRHLFGLWCSVLGGGPPITRVHLFDFSFEKDNRSFEVAFEAYGAVKSVKKQTFLSNQIIFNGTRLVDVAFSGVLPRFLMVDGYLCCLWYRGEPLACNLCAVQGHWSANCPNKDKCRKCGNTRHFARNCTFHRPAGDLDLVPVSGDSSEAESNQRASKRVGKDKGSSAKRSSSAPSPTFNICFTNSQKFNSLVANSAELDGITSKGNNESTVVRNISNERLNVINDDTSANSTERVNKVINNSSTERSSEVNDITTNESNESSGGLNEVNAINPNIAVVENVAEMEYVDVMAGADAATS